MEQYEYLNGPPSPRMVAELAMRHDALVKQLADAQATIAALQARVQELEDGTSALLNQQSERLAVENEKLTMALSQLAQRTAELERVTGERDQLLTCQCEGCDESLEGSAYCERCFAKLRTLVLALPKVEGAVVVSNGYVKDSTRCHALFGADEDAALYAALLQHRQGMEG